MTNDFIIDDNFDVATWEDFEIKNALDLVGEIQISWLKSQLRHAYTLGWRTCEKKAPGSADRV